MSPSAPTDTWLSITDAAAVLGCSTRTVARRLAAGDFRRQERDGRVLVAIPEALRRPADRMVEAVQQDAAHMRQLSAAVTQATEQAGMVLREAVAQAREDAALAIDRAAQAEARGRRAWRIAALLGMAAVCAVTATVSVSLEAARIRAEGRQMAATVSEAKERAAVAEAQRDAAQGILAALLGTDTVRQATDTPEQPMADLVPAVTN
ncbi:MAG: hypothetical protein EBY30_17075 [Rhodospirillales bacterium]|jgi:hypothetical protein|nr:hypothetical protein [Rhodospirillales bacterium]